MLSVPEQDVANWYPEKGWILPAKVKITKAITDKRTGFPFMNHPIGPIFHSTHRTLSTIWN